MKVGASFVFTLTYTCAVDHYLNTSVLIQVDYLYTY